MSNYWTIDCSCGAHVPPDGINHGGELLAEVLSALPEILALAAKGIAFEIDVYRIGVARGLSGDWFAEHSKPGHVLHVEDEYGTRYGDPRAGG